MTAVVAVFSFSCAAVVEAESNAGVAVGDAVLETPFASMPFSVGDDGEGVEDECTASAASTRSARGGPALLRCEGRGEETRTRGGRSRGGLRADFGTETSRLVP